MTAPKKEPPTDWELYEMILNAGAPGMRAAIKALTKRNVTSHFRHDAICRRIARLWRGRENERPGL